jgi:hypothetical protein
VEQASVRTAGWQAGLRHRTARAEDGGTGAVLPKGALAPRIKAPRFDAFYPLATAITQTFGAIATNASTQVPEPDG